MEKREYKNVERKIKEIARQYSNNGFTVKIYPSGNDLPNFMHNYQPDILAKKDDEYVIIEVKTKGSTTDLAKFEMLANEVNTRPNWRFEVVFTNPQETPINMLDESSISHDMINQRLIEARKLLELNLLDGAFLLCWTALEAAIRQMLKLENDKLINKSPQSMIKNLYALGLINKIEYKSLDKYIHARNTLIHGFNYSVTRNDLEELLNFVNSLVNPTKKRLIYSWLNNIDFESYEDIYSLYLTVYSQDDYGMFNYEKKDDVGIITTDTSEDELELVGEKEHKEFIKIIEQEFMDNMDAEGWYGFHRAMDKDD